MATKKKIRYILQYLHTPPELFVFVFFVSTIFRNEGYISMGRTDMQPQTKAIWPWK